jgi:acetolactate synthase-1/2/3 large subunit
MNNNQHGMVAQFQEENMDGRYIGTRVGYSAPDFSSVAKSYGIQAIRIENMIDLRSAEAAVSDLGAGPLVLEFVISASAKALPKMSSGNSIQDL